MFLSQNQLPVLKTRFNLSHFDETESCWTLQPPCTDTCSLSRSWSLWGRLRFWWSPGGRSWTQTQHHHQHHRLTNRSIWDTMFKRLRKLSKIMLIKFKRSDLNDSLPVSLLCVDTSMSFRYLDFNQQISEELKLLMVSTVSPPEPLSCCIFQFFLWFHKPESSHGSSAEPQDMLRTYWTTWMSHDGAETQLKLTGRWLKRTGAVQL